MAKIQTKCPRCNQPILADVEQLFDLNKDLRAKQRFLSGTANMVRCQSCAYEGPVHVPIVYHDPEKELLLTYFPPELGVPLNEQERQIGPLINQVVNALPPEKKKGYIFQPQSMLTFQTLVEKVLEADGITKEMIEGQQKRLNLLQRLLSITDAGTRAEVIKQDVALVDNVLFSLLSTLIQSALAQGDEKAAGLLSQVQKELLEQTPFGRELVARSEEAEEAIKALQEAGKDGLTREKLLDLFINAKSDVQLNTLVSMARSGLDYNFFQILSEKIEQSKDAEKEHLTGLRDKLLEMTRQIDEAVKKRFAETTELLNALLKEENMEAAVTQVLPVLDEFFSQAVQAEFEKAREKGDVKRIEKLQKLVSIIQKATEPPAEIKLVQKLMDAPDDSSRMKLLEESADLVTPDLAQMLSGIIAESEARKESREVIDALQAVYRLVLRFSMEKQL